jgi:hypothetical protein
MFTMPPGRAEIRKDVRDAVRVAFSEEYGVKIVERFTPVFASYDESIDENISIGGVAIYKKPISSPVIIDGRSPFV